MAAFLTTIPQGASAATLQVALARLLLEGAMGNGARDLVVSPGSRSTPLVLAALELPQLRIHDVVDERSAAFFALGQARATGRPSILVCTSGSAGAHYFPAVLEAEAAFLPLIVLTADRPHERQDCAAPQTADQLALYGRHVRAAFDIPVAEPRERVLRSARRIGAQAAARAQSPVPGPVHVNLRARKPLEPDESSGAAASPAERPADRPGVRVKAPVVVPSAGDVAELLERCHSAVRPLVVCGPSPLRRSACELDEVLRLLRGLDSPVFAEATSQLRFLDPAARSGVRWCDELAVVLDSPPARRLLDPDLVVQLESPPISAGYEDLLESGSSRHHVVLAEHGFPDPVSTATLLVQAPLAATAGALSDALAAAPGANRSREWVELVRGLCDSAREAVEEVLRGGVASSDEPSALGEGRVARVLAQMLPPGALLALGNSLPIRSMEAFAPAAVRRLRVWSQRGLAGIDGLLSGVAGSLVSLGAESAPPPAAALLLGDLSFLHDLGGLATLRHVGVPLAVVVVQNRGGRIFEQLPLASSRSGPAVLPHFVMTQELDVGGAAAAFGLPFARVRNLAELEEALRAAFAHAGASVVEAVVPDHAAASERAALRRAMAAAAQALSTGRPGAR